LGKHYQRKRNNQSFMKLNRKWWMQRKSNQ
jgi:hypothetical protein